MTKLLVRWGIIVIALIAAAWLLPGIEVYGAAWVVYAVMAVILGLINAVIRPLLKFLTCPLIILTLGLFVLVINAITFLLAAGISNRVLRALELGGGFAVRSFGWAFLAALIVSIVTVILSALVKEDK
jgi:putative membrane protein